MKVDTKSKIVDFVILLKYVALFDLNMSLEREFNQEREELINQRHMLFCDNCYWCLSYLPDLENNGVQHFRKCQKCHQNLRRMYISEKASRRFDDKGSQGMSEYEELLVA